MKTVTQTAIMEIPLFRRGKVRDVYDLGDSLLIVATDRLSAFDVVMSNPIPFKGAVLTSLSVFWFHQTKHICGNHFITNNTDEFPERCQNFREQLDGRSMVVRKTKPLPIECVVRGYIAGSGWKEYQKSKSICSIPLPEGLLDSSKLPEPIFTPSTKAEEGHDQNISFDVAASIIGKDSADAVRDLSIALYSHAHDYALERNIIIADTKFEFGLSDDGIILIDEALTPDSSRFWPLQGYTPGKSQPSYDKQFVRDYLESIQWNKQPPPPDLPAEVISMTTEKYLSAYKLITGEELHV